MADAPLAIVTGASSGIGAEFARQLAASGHSLVLVARSKEGLDAVRESCGVPTGSIDVIPCDLSVPEGMDVIERVISDRAPDLVVNNAGFGWHGPFEDHFDDELTDLIQLNVLALARLSRAAFEVMRRRGSGGILNVSSIASFMPGPTVAAYHASKAFVTSLSEALHVEATGSGVRVTVLCPGITPTGFQARAGTQHAGLPRLVTTSAARVAADGLAALARGDAICVPGVANKIIGVLSKVTPRAVVRSVAGTVIGRL